MTISKPELIEKVKATVKPKDVISDAQITRIVDAVFDNIVSEVAAGNEVTIVGFGSFKSATQAARSGVAMGVAYDTPETTVPKFKAGKAFKAAVADK